jgi:hypothetical protein
MDFEKGKKDTRSPSLVDMDMENCTSVCEHLSLSHCKKRKEGNVEVFIDIIHLKL